MGDDAPGKDKPHRNTARRDPGDRDPAHRIPLIPLTDIVHFPRTRVRLQVHQPRYRRLVREVMAEDEEIRLIGLVLVKPGAQQPEGGHREIFPGGTAARLVDVDLLPDGRSTIVLQGQYRFVIRYEVDSQPYRRALVEPVEEPRYNDADAGIQMVRGEILEVARLLAREASDRFPFDDDALDELRSHSSFEELVNSLSADLDLPTLRKLQLLTASLPDRALNLLGILNARRRVLDLLRPFRPLADHPEHN